MLLKPNMVLSGTENASQASVDQVAEATLACFRDVVPAAVPGIVFLSGGQSDVSATEHLSAMNAMYGNLPWEISFSWARALQQKPMEIWGGDPSNVEEAQRVFHHRTRMASAARYGSYSEDMEKELAA